MPDYNKHRRKGNNITLSLSYIWFLTIIQCTAGMLTAVYWYSGSTSEVVT